MSPQTPYTIHLDVKFNPLEVVDVNAFAAAVTAPWFNQTLVKVNESVVRLGLFQSGEFHWHQHAGEDEFFFTLSGCFVIELEGRTVELRANQGFMVPRGVRHRTRVSEPTVILMVESATIQPTGD